MFKLLKSKESKNAMWLIGGRIAQMLLQLTVGIITARYLGPANHGLINYGTAYVAFFSALCGLGINSVIIKDFVDNPNEQGEAIGSALVMKFVASVLSFIMTFCITFFVDNGETLTITVVVLCSFSSILHIFDTLNYWFQNQYQSKITSITTLCAYIITTLYKICLLIFGKNVKWFALATSIDYLVVAIILLLAYKKYDGPRLKFSIRKCKSLIKVSYNYILSTLMVVIYGQTDKLMLKQFLGTTEVGYYATAVSICAMWTFVLKAIIDALYPTILRLYDIDRKAFEKKNRQLYAIVFYISSFVSCCFFIFGDWAIQLFYGTEYAPAGMPLKIITWYTAFSYLGVARNAWIVSEGKQKYLKYMYLSSALINVFLNYMLIPLFGVSGAAIASLITEFSANILLPLLIAPLRPNAKLMIEAILLRKVE